MELLEAIYNRRAVRSFRPDQIADEVLNKILEAGTWAPSHGNNQPWEFIIIGQETRDKLQKVYSEMMEAGPLKNPSLPEENKALVRKFITNFGGAPLLLAVVCPPPIMPVDSYDFPLAAGAAIQNISLAAWEKEIGSVWLSLGSFPQVKPLLDVQPEGCIAGILAMGYPAMVPEAQPRVAVSEKTRRLP